MSAHQELGCRATLSELSARMEEAWNNYRRMMSSNRETSRSLPFSPKVLWAFLRTLACISEVSTVREQLLFPDDIVLLSILSLTWQAIAFGPSALCSSPKG